MQTSNATTSNMSKIICDESVSTNGSNEADHEKPSVSTLSSSSNRKRIVDETLLTPAEAESLLERRAYNRECATRARKRVKETISQLEKQVKELQDDKAELRRSLVVMEKQVLSLTQEKRELQTKIQVLRSVGGSGGSHMIGNTNIIGGLTSVVSPPPYHLMQLQQLQQQQRQLQLNASLQGRGFC